jgi:hypothetical protein
MLHVIGAFHSRPVGRKHAPERCAWRATFNTAKNKFENVQQCCIRNLQNCVFDTLPNLLNLQKKSIFCDKEILVGNISYFTIIQKQSDSESAITSRDMLANISVSF